VLAGIADSQKLLLAREWPVDLALGQQPAFDILGPDGPNATAEKLADYYRMLSVGFHSALVASTDGYIDQGRTYPGAARTYAHLQNLTWEAVSSAHRSGGTFATNGPLVWLSVNGKQPGEDALVSRGGTLTIALRAVSNWGVTRAEVIMDGRVVHTAMPREDGEIRDTLTIPGQKSGWIALRVFGPKSDGIASDLIPRDWQREGIGQFAHTSPVYFTIAGQPMPPDPDAARYFARWIVAYRTALLNRTDLFANENGTWGDDVKARILERLARAEAVYLQKAREGARR
jgi:hypothetical protein